jgi:hypothetical protein
MRLTSLRAFSPAFLFLAIPLPILQGQQLHSQPDITTASDSVVTFNEVMYHPVGDDPTQEWVELYNQMSIDMDISNWRLEGGADFQFPTNTVLRANNYLVLAANPDVLRSTGLTNVYGPFTKRLSNGGETLRLRNNSGRLMDEMSYTDQEPWPLGPDGSGASLAKKDRFDASSPAANWRASAQPGGTPGKPNLFESQARVPQDEQFITPSSLSKWIVPSDGVSGLAWTALDFDDASWNSGKAALGYDAGGAGTGSLPDRMYLFDGNILDASGQGFDGQNSGGQFSTNIPPLVNGGRSISFDGLSSTVVVNDGVNPTDYTIAAWVFVDTVRPCNLIVRTDGNGPRTSWSHQLRINAAGHFEHFLFDGNARSVAATTIVAPGVWYYIAGTAKAGGEMAIYVNGTSSGGTVMINDLWAGGDRWIFGGDSTEAPNFFAGKLDNVAIWHSALSADAIRQLAGGASPSELGGAFTGLFQTDVQSAMYEKNSSLYVRIPFTPAAGANYDQLSLQVQYADGFVAFLNGTEIARRNAPAQPAWNSQAPLDRDTSAAVQPETINLSSFASKPVNGKNVLAFEGLNSSANDKAFLLNVSLTARQPQEGATEGVLFNEISAASDPSFFVELFNHGAGSVNLSNWTILSSTGPRFLFPAQSLAAKTFLVLHTNELGFAVQKDDRLFLLSPGLATLDAVAVAAKLRGKLPEHPDGAWLYPSKSTPGQPNEFVLHNEIVINEIMYSYPPQYRTTNNPFTEIPEQWIELYNRSNSTVDLTGWHVDGEVSFDFPVGTRLDPDTYLVIANDLSALRLKYPNITILGNFKGKLSHRAGRIVLSDPAGNPANELTYYNSHPWPEYPNGGGSTLELRDPRSDNSLPESWGASVETGKSSWQHYSYTARAITPVYTPGIFGFNEFRMGLLTDGEALLDNVTVTELPTTGPRQLLQNTDFTAGTSKWRLLGNHSHSVVEPNPDDPSNPVLHLVSRGPMSYMDNRLETTLKVGATSVPVVAGRDYEISFDAKWVAGSPQLHTELYYNKVTETTILKMPELFGTPGRRNSIFTTNAGPTYTALQHTPILPKSSESISLNIHANDPDGVAGLKVFYSANAGAWQNVAMASDAFDTASFTGKIPPQPSGAVIQFYIQGTDSLGAISSYPAAAAASRALIKVDNARIVNGKQTIRTIMTAADSSLLHSDVNMMSDDLLGCTVIHNEQEVFYDAKIRLHGSMFSRDQPNLTGFTIKFPADHLFRGSRESIIVRRRGMVETVVKHVLNAAGGLPGNYDDIIYLVSHRSDNLGNARLNLANYDDTYVDSQFENNNSGTVFKLEGIREYQTTANGNKEGLKLSQPIGWIVGFDIANLGNDPEQYRWGIMIQSQRARDDYSRIVAMGKAFSLPTGPALHDAAADTIDVDEWARLFALQNLVGIADVYGVENPHNFAFYVRPDNSRVAALQNDWEFAFANSASGSIYGNKNVYKVLRLPGFRRLYQKHLLDLINTACNGPYMTPWVKHFSSVTGESYTSYSGYLNTRAASVRNQLLAKIPFEITSNSGADITVDSPVVTLQGNGWIDIHTIRRTGDSNALPVNWLDDQRWQLTLPLTAKTNVIVLEAFDFRGRKVGEDVIGVTTTVSEFPQRDYLRITELMYHPPSPTASEAAAGFLDADEFEFMELLNSGPAEISLLGAKLASGVTFDFSTGTITNLPAGQRVLVVRNKAAFEARYGTSLPVAGEYGGSLSNGGELIRLVDSLGIIIQEFTYSDSNGWPSSADGNGTSIEVIDLKGNYNDPGNWQASPIGGTPGSETSIPPSFVSAAINAGNISLRFQAAPKQNYTIYYTDNLLVQNWQVLSKIPADPAGKLQDVSDPASAVQRFYKLSAP